MTVTKKKYMHGAIFKKLNVLAYSIIARLITWKGYGILGMQQNEKHELVKKVKAQAWTGP